MRSFLMAHRSSRRGLIAGVLLLILLLAALPFLPRQLADAHATGTTIRIVLADSQISPGEAVTAEVRLENVTDLLKVKFRLGFDPNVVQVVDSADPSQPVTEIQVGSLIGKWSKHKNEVWHSHGYLVFDYDIPSNGQPVSGTGPVALITWGGVGAGTSDLTFEEVFLSDGSPIEYSVVNGQIQVVVDTPTPTPSHAPTDTPVPTHTPTWTSTPTNTPSPTLIPTHTATPTPTNTPVDTPVTTGTPTHTPSPTGVPTATITPTPSRTPGTAPVIRGRILLQGRSDHAGTAIYLREDACTGPPSGPPSAVTIGNGDFEITPTSGHTYLCLQAFKPSYLIGQKGSPQGDVGTITLPAGDVTQDSVIDIRDLVFIADRLHRPDDPVADLNADGWIDVYDLAIASSNYDRSGPTSDWQ